MSWIDALWERAAAWPGTLKAYGEAQTLCLELGGHLWTPLACGEVLRYGHPGVGYRLVRCLRCGLSERRLVLDEECG